MADYNSDRTGSNIDLTLDKVDALDAKVQPTATGANVTGTLVADGLTVDGDATVQSQSGNNATFLIGQSGITNWRLINEAGTGDLKINDSPTSSAMRIVNNGNVSFYEDTGTTAKMVWDASAESLGIGTASPSHPLDVVGNISAGGVFGRIRNNDTSSAATYVQMKLETGLNDAYVGAYSGSGGNGYLVFGNENTERARIDSSGNLLVGTTSSPTGSGQIVANNGIYLGGTDAANKLDDYEEGTFTSSLTPSSSGSITLQTANDTLAYTKIGRTVHVQGRLIVDSVSSPIGYIKVSLPFSVADLNESADLAKVTPLTLGAFSVGSNDIGGFSQQSTAEVRLYNISGTLSSDSAQQMQANTIFYFNFSYIAA